jgi:hypothetical protein
MEDAMSEPTPDRPMDDDLDQAYARSHALADDGRGPSASVRANVLAAAARVAAGQDAAAAPPPLVPVAPPVAAVGRGRERAINLSSWRVRSGAAFCALMLVCLGIWRLDQNGRVSGGVQVALAELRLAEPRTAPAPRDLPLPAAAAASYPYAAPPPVVVDPLDNSASVRGAAAKRGDRDKDVVVAQLDEREKRAAAPRAAAEADGLAQSRAAQPAPAPARPPAAADAATQPSATLASNAPDEQESATVTVVAAAPGASPQVVTAPPKLPSVLPRRLMLVPRPPASAAAKAAPGGNTVVATAESADASRGVQRVEIQSAAPVMAAAAPAPVAAFAPSASEPTALAKPDVRLASNADASKRARADLSGAGAQATPLHAAADRGDVDTLKALLADPAVRVDTPDADGRTALLRAVLAQRPAAVRLLLAAGADPARADHAGLTPRQAAQTGASAEIAVLLAAPR